MNGGSWLFRREDKGQQLLDLLNDSFKNGSRSVVAGFILSLGGSLLLFITFCLIRPRHNLTYAPKLRYTTDDEKKPEALSKNPVSWFWKVFSTPEQVLIDRLGIDAAVFVRFMIMLRNMFISLSVIGCGIAIPINVIYNKKSGDKKSVDNLGVFGLTTPMALQGLPWVAHIVLGYATNAVVLTFLWINFRRVTQIRRRAFMTKELQNSLFMRTLLVTEIPKKYLSEEGLAHLMSQYRYTKPIQQINIGKNVKELTKLLEQHEKAIHKLEKLLAKYLKNPDKLPAQRPTCKPEPEDRKYLENKVDAIDYYIKRAMRLEKQINTCRDAIDNRSSLPYGLVSYSTPEDCHLVAKNIGQGRRNKTLIQLAPRAEDIIWKNMVLTKAERKNKQWWGNCLYAAMLVLWIVPNAFIGCFLTDLSRIGQLWSPFSDFMNSHKTLFAVLQGFLAPLVTTLVFMVLPTIMRRTSQWQGKITKSEREHDVTLKLFVFFFFNNFFVVTLISVGWSIATMVIQVVQEGKADGVNSVEEGIKKEAAKMSVAIIRASSFWIMYILRVNLGAMLDLLQVVTLLWSAIQRYVMSPTPRELMLATAPQPFHYAVYYNWCLFYSCIALAFVTIQPIILPILAFYLCVDTVLKKYTLMYMFVTKCESDGRYWPLLNNCLLFGAGFGNLVLLAVVWSQSGDWPMAVAIAPLPISVVIFKIVQAKKFNSLFHYFIPTAHEREMMEMSASVANTWEMRSNLEDRYLNPAINRRLPVPMVHAKAEPLLREACRMDAEDGNDDFMYEANPFLPGSKQYRKRQQQDHNRRSQIGDNKFDLIGENELDYEHYQRIAERSTPTEMSTYDASVADQTTLSHYPSKEEHLVTPPQPPYYQQHRAYSNNTSDNDSLYLAPSHNNSFYTHDAASQSSLHNNGYYYGYSSEYVGNGVAAAGNPQMHESDDRVNLLDPYNSTQTYPYADHQQRHW